MWRPPYAGPTTVKGIGVWDSRAVRDHHNVTFRLDNLREEYPKADGRGEAVERYGRAQTRLRVDGASALLPHGPRHPA
jgi:hypothetical protein